MVMGNTNPRQINEDEKRNHARIVRNARQTKRNGSSVMSCDVLVFQFCFLVGVWFCKKLLDARGEEFIYNHMDLPFPRYIPLLDYYFEMGGFWVEL